METKYKMISQFTAAKRGVAREEHRAVVEKVLGRKLKSNEVVHHINEDRSDNRPENLLVCSRAYHNLIHARMRALKAFGDANARICKFCKEYDLVPNIAVRGTSAQHKDCFNAYRREWRNA